MTHYGHSEATDKIAAALAAAQGELAHVLKDKANPFFKSKYADLAAVVEEVRRVLPGQKIAYTQMGTCDDSGKLYLVTTLWHGGQWISGALPVKPVKDDPQGMGSAMTYARRYGLAAAVGLAPDEDDDGNAASNRTREPVGPPERKTAKRPSTPAKRAPSSAGGSPEPVLGGELSAILSAYRERTSSSPEEVAEVIGVDVGDLVVAIGGDPEDVDEKAMQRIQLWVAKHA